jgi:hypothetical protein
MEKNLILDEVMEISEVGNRDTYDFVIPKTHCYIANGILVHNSADVEADADIVILLHREPKGGEGTDYPQFEEHEGVFDERTLVRVSKSRYSIGGQLYLKSIDAECRIEEYQ